MNLSFNMLSFKDKHFGQNQFRGKVAEKYLSKVGLSASVLESAAWTQDGSADKVATAVVAWAKDNGAAVCTHWFQPMASAGVREGQTGQVHTHMVNFDSNGEPVWELTGKTMMKGESDGSSFPHGGLRATHTAAGYTVLDPSSPIFLRGDTVFFPSIFITFNGHAIDEKTPLLRAVQVASSEGKRLLHHLGYDVEGLVFNVGLEQEFFLVPREAYLRRPDLQLAGRTVIGKMPCRGQEMCDHYMAPPNDTVVTCMQEIQEECYKVGIPLRVRHREVAPNQYEFCPFFGSVSTQVDQNLMLMQMITEIAKKHGLACLMHEKPFQGVNGSGKHNNWSISTADGVNLMNPGQVQEATGNAEIFPIILAAVLRAVDLHGDLLRCAVATPGNDFRLGAGEAPPAIISTYLGDDLTAYLEEFKQGKTGEYVPKTRLLDCGISGIAPISVPSEDRNRTSPFPYGGHRFEFRALGSSQNAGFVNTVLCAIVADSFRAFSEAIEAGRKPHEVAAEALTQHWRSIFNGNGYAAEWPAEASERGIWRIDSGVAAMERMRHEKNVALFESLNIFSPEECVARAKVALEHYIGTVEMEASCLVDMIQQQILPAMRETGCGDLAAVGAAAVALKKGLKAMHAAASDSEKAEKARELRLTTMLEAREACDAAEAVVPADKWPLATYKDLLFLDYTS